MNINDFLLERYFAKHEFNARYLFSSSDCDGYSLKYVLDQASDDEKEHWNNLTLGYTESEGNTLLRESISSLYTSVNRNETLVLSPGEANFILMNILLKRGDHVVCMAPAYQSLYQVAKSLGCELTFWEPDEKTWHFNPDDLKKLVTEKTKLIIINFPHNPTGAFPSVEEFSRIVEIAASKGIFLFSDEMYRKLNHSGVDEVPAVCDVYERGISLWGMAKTFGLAGLRIGWLATHDQNILKQVQSFKDYLTICNSAPSEILALIAINNRDEFILPNLEKIRNNINLFQEFCDKNSRVFDFIKPLAGSTGFMKLKTKESAGEFSERILKKAEIMIVPSEMFEFGNRHIRIGFGRENFKEILLQLENYL